MTFAERTLYSTQPSITIRLFMIPYGMFQKKFASGTNNRISKSSDSFEQTLFRVREVMANFVHFDPLILQVIPYELYSLTR